MHGHVPTTKSAKIFLIIWKSAVITACYTFYDLAKDIMIST